MKYKTFLIIVFTLLFAIAGCSNSANNISTFNNPAQPGSKFPYLYSTGNQIYMSWIHQTKAGKTILNYALYSNGTWSDVHPIAEGSSWFVNWADFPSIIANRQGPVAAHWLDKIPGGTYAYNVNISLVHTNREWTPPLVPHFDSTATEHGFVSMVPWNDTTILAVWLDGRQSANDTAKEYYDLDNAMTLRGALISTSGKVVNSFLIDDSVCDCCSTSLIKTEGGAIVAYRNRTTREIRDIYLSRFDGTTWSTPKAIYNDNWKIGACPVNGPKLAAADSLVVLAWHTMAGNKAMVKASISIDGGATFNDPQIIAENGSLGRVDAVIYNGKAFVSWMEKSNDEVYIKLNRLDTQGTAPKTITISKINGSRKTGFPQLEVSDDYLVMAWTAVDSTAPGIKTVQINLPI